MILFHSNVPISPVGRDAPAGWGLPVWKGQNIWLFWMYFLFLDGLRMAGLWIPQYSLLVILVNHTFYFCQKSVFNGKMYPKQNASLLHARIGLDLEEAESEEGLQAKLWMGSSHFLFLIFQLVIFYLFSGFTVKWKYVYASLSLIRPGQCFGNY